MMAMRYFPLVAGLLCCLALEPTWAQELYCKPCWHGFGNVQIGSSSSDSFRLSNIGSKTLRITSKSKQGSEFSFGKFPLPVNLRPGASVQLPITFKPTAKGYSTGFFQLVSTAKDSKLTMKAAGFGKATANPGLRGQSRDPSFGERHGGIECQAGGYAQGLERFRNHLVRPVNESSEFALLD